MRVISMLDDYRKMCNSSEAQGNYEAYKIYAAKYPTLFNAVEKYLYNCTLDNLKDYIEGCNFIALLQQGEANYENGLFDWIPDYVESCSKRMGIDFQFNLYLGLELGNIGGASLPVEDEIQFVYIGMDRPVDSEFCTFFVPHELHHLLRIHRTGEKDSITLKARMVSEGLASYCPLWLENLQWNTETIALSLGIKQKSAQYMLEHSDSLIKELWVEGDKSLNQEVMTHFFTTSNKDDNVCIPGYFVGILLTHMLVEQGYNFMNLTNMDTPEILSLMETII